MSFEARSFTFIKRIVQLLKCFMSRSQAGKVIYGLDTVIHLQRIAPTPPNIERAGRRPLKLPLRRVRFRAFSRCL
jgi:hypothetical protein